MLGKPPHAWELGTHNFADSSTELDSRSRDSSRSESYPSPEPASCLRKRSVSESQGTHLWGMAESQPSGRLPWWRRNWLALAGLCLIVLVAPTRWSLPRCCQPGSSPIAPGAKVDDNTRFNAVVNTRAALLGSVWMKMGGLAGNSL